MSQLAKPTHNDQGYEYRFTINGYNPDDLSMHRLAEYITRFAQLLGKNEKIHFKGIEQGSTTLICSVDPQEATNIENLVKLIKELLAPSTVMDAFKRFNNMLFADETNGSLTLYGKEVLPFLGINRQNPTDITIVEENDSIDGVLIRVGGRKSNSFPVHLREGNNIHICQANRQLAREIASHLLGTTLRVYGQGNWNRSIDGKWSLKSFSISRFEELDETPLSELVDQLHKVEGSNWKSIDDPVAEIRRMRGSGELR